MKAPKIYLCKKCNCFWPYYYKFIPCRTCGFNTGLTHLLMKIASVNNHFLLKVELFLRKKQDKNRIILSKVFVFLNKIFVHNIIWIFEEKEIEK